MAAAACSSSDPKNELPTNTGGSTSTGGATETGGSTSTGGASSGGSTSSGGSSSGGSTPESGGAANTGGSTPGDGGGTDPDAGYPPNPGTVDVVSCTGDGVSCSESEVCCYTRAVTFPTQTPEKFTCSDKPCTGGDLAIACDGLEDCHGGQECCRVDTIGGATSYTCRDSCPGAVIGCTGQVNCPASMVCCLSTFLNSATGTACTSECSGSNQAIMCAKKSDCPANAPNCVNSSTVPGMRVCSP